MSADATDVHFHRARAHAPPPSGESQTTRVISSNLAARRAPCTATLPPATSAAAAGGRRAAASRRAVAPSLVSSDSCLASRASDGGESGCECGCGWPGGARAPLGWSGRFHGKPGPESLAA